MSESCVCRCTPAHWACVHLCHARRSTGCAFRSAMTRLVNSVSSASASFQRNHEISLSWHQALLLPPCVRPNSSPPSSIGTPCDRKSVVMKFRCCRARNALTVSSSVVPSTPQFQERLSSAPSWLFSPFSSLCFSLYETRSRNVKPSCAVTKLIDANGERPSPWYKSLEPVNRDANSDTGACARQKSRMLSRYNPFHSPQRTGKLPT